MGCLSEASEKLKQILGAEIRHKVGSKRCMNSGDRDRCWYCPVEWQCRRGKRRMSPEKSEEGWEMMYQGYYEVEKDEEHQHPKGNGWLVEDR